MMDTKCERKGRGFFVKGTSTTTKTKAKKKQRKKKTRKKTREKKRRIQMEVKEMSRTEDFF